MENKAEEWGQEWATLVKGVEDDLSRKMIFKQSPETQKLKHAEARLLCSTPYDPTIPFLGIDPEKTIKSQHYYNIRDKEATSVSINRGMDKQDVGQIYSGILLCG